MKKLAVSGLVLAMLTGGEAKAAGSCAKADEMAALNSRVVQSWLMLAALTCDERPRYNAFVTRFRSALSGQGAVLRSYFSRAYGDASESRLNKFVTTVANNVSDYSHEKSGGTPFCFEARRIFLQAESLPEERYTELLSNPSLSRFHGIKSCGAEVAKTD